MRCLEKKGLLTMSSQLIGMLAASTQGDADAKSLQTGAWVAGNATQHNYLSHWQEEKKRQEVDGCKDKQLCKTGIEAKWAIISAQQDVGIVVGVGGGIGLSTAETAVGVYELVKNWRETYAALEQLATSPEFRRSPGPTKSPAPPAPTTGARRWQGELTGTPVVHLCGRFSVEPKMSATSRNRHRAKDFRRRLSKSNVACSSNGLERNCPPGTGNDPCVKET